MLTNLRVKELLQQYRPRFAFNHKFESKKSSNFLNFVKKIEGSDGSPYVVKLPKAFTDIICFLRIGSFHLLGDEAVIFAPFPQRMKNEKEKIGFLKSRGIPALPLAGIETEGVLVTRWVKGANLKDIFSYDYFSLEDKLKILSQSVRRLKEIHTCFGHGDAQARNIFVADSGEIIWLDYEYVLNPGIPPLRQKARDLMLLLSSSTKHLKKPVEVVKVILDSYPDREVKEAMCSLSVYQSIAYNFFLDLMNPILCLKMIWALRNYGGEK